MIATDKFTIHECERFARHTGFDHATFDLCGPSGKRLKCTWLDAYLGMFTVEGQEGFMQTSMVDQFGHGFWCENFKANE